MLEAWSSPHHARSEQVLVPLLEHCCGRQCGTHHLLQVFLSNNSVLISWLRITTTSHLPPRLDWTTPGRSDNIHRHRQPGPLDPHSLSRWGLLIFQQCSRWDSPMFSSNETSCVLLNSSEVALCLQASHWPKPALCSVVASLMWKNSFSSQP